MRSIRFLLTLAFAAGMASAPASSAHATSTFYVAITGSDANPGTAALPWRTIQHAADLAGPGDSVVVSAGTYVGARFAASGTGAQPISFLAQSGVVVNAPGPQNSNGDGLWVRNANHVVLQGFELTDLPRAGIAVQGEPSAPATGVVLRQNHAHHNGRWGIFTGYAEAVLIEDNETSYSDLEHGIYVSNSADRPVIRGNHSHHNNAAGVQINADPALAGDGIITGAVVEDNVIHDNGAGGAAGINLASVRKSVIRNNLLYDNHATGIAGWDDGAGSQWGTRRNLIANNTVVQASDGRFALSLFNGSTGNVVANNVLYHPGTRGSVEIDSSSRTGFVCDFNVAVEPFSVDETWISWIEWRALGYDAHSLLEPSLASLFVNPGQDDYHLSVAGPAVDAGYPIALVPDDLEGTTRPQGGGHDIGADEAA